MKKINQFETKEIIEGAKLAKKEGKSLKKAFLEFALKYGYSEGSVRNHYYKVVKTTKKGSDLYEKLGLTDRLIPVFIKEFSLAEEKELLYLIAKGVALGKSVRKTILELSNGNEKLALRYQNKFRNLVKENSPLITHAVDRVEKELGVKVYFQKRAKSSEFKKLENEINKMLDGIIRGISEENRKLKARASLLEKENTALKKVVKKTMQDQNFDRFAKAEWKNTSF